MGWSNKRFFSYEGKNTSNTGWCVLICNDKNTQSDWILKYVSCIEENDIYNNETTIS